MASEMELLRYVNEWPWGVDVTYIFTDGMGTIGVGFEEGYDFGYIHDLMVYPDARGQGRGKFLLARAEREIAEQGWRYAVLRVVPGTWVESFYRRSGYGPYRQPRDGCRLDYIELRKNLK